MNKKLFLILVFCMILGAALISAAVITDDLHLNIQVTHSNGTIIPSTSFDFAFNISTSSTCSPVIYSNLTTITTDTRGIISYYLPVDTLDYDVQYWLCYYRDGVLINNSKIARVPYTFTAKNISAEGVKNDSNLDLTNYNVTADWGLFNYLGSLANEIISLFVEDVDISNNLSVGGNLSVDTDTLFVDSNNDRVGIGTGSPSRTFEVVGEARITKSGGVGGDSILEIIAGETSGESQLRFGDTDLDVGQIMYDHATDKMSFRTNAVSDRMVIDSSGNVGIGTSSPSYLLEVAKGTENAVNLSGLLYINDSSSVVDIGAIGSDVPYLFNTADANSRLLRISSPTSYSGDYGISARRTVDNNIGFDLWYDTSAGALFLDSLWNNDATIIQFRTKLAGGPGNIVEVMTLKGDGNVSIDGTTFNVDAVNDRVGIGTTTPQNTLNVDGDANVTGTLYYGTLDGEADLNVNDSDYLDSYDSLFFAPLNKSLIGDFNITGSLNVDGNWQSGGVTIDGGDIFAQALYVYSMYGLNVGELNINGSLIPQLFNNTFDIGNATLWWRDLYLGGDAHVAGDANIAGTIINTDFTTLTDNSMADTLHRHSELSASDGTPDAILSVDADGKVTIGDGTSGDLLEFNTERAWKFTQGSTGATSSLDLQTTIDGKRFRIVSADGNQIPFAVIASNTAALNEVEIMANVGIGTSAPDAKLDVFGTTDFGIKLSSDTGNSANWIIFQETSVDAMKILYDGANNEMVIRDEVGDTDLVTIERAGNVGIGTSSPGGLLEIHRASAGTASHLNFTDGAYQIGGIGPVGSADGTGLFFTGYGRTGLDPGITLGGYVNDSTPNNDYDAAVAIRGYDVTDNSALANMPIFRVLNTHASLYFTVEADGNVGIGTSSPMAGVRQTNVGTTTLASHYGQLVLLDDTAIAADVGGMIYFGGKYTGSTYTTWAGIGGLKEDAVDGNFGGELAFYTRPDPGLNTERMRIDAAGNVGIGTTPSQKLHVHDGITYLTSDDAITFKALYLRNLDASGNAENVYQTYHYHSGGSHRYFSIGQAGAGTNRFDIAPTSDLTSPVFSILADGKVGIGTSSPKGILHLGTTTTHTNINTNYKQIFAGALTLMFREARDSYILNNVYYNTSNKWVNLYGTYGSTILNPSDGKFVFATAPAVDAGSEATFTERLTILQAGNVGIGTSSPDEKLDITGDSADIYLRQADDYWSAILGSDGAGAGYLNIYRNNVDADFADALISLSTISGTNSWINTGDNVGIGTDSPVINLHVDGGATNYAQLKLTSDSTGATLTDGFDVLMDTTGHKLIGREALPMNFYTSNDLKMTILADGKVGIGTSSPTAILQLYTTGSPYIHFSNDATGALVTDGSIVGGNSEDDLLIWNREAAGIIQFATANAEKMRLDASGNLGIGTDSPAVQLHINNSGVANMEISSSDNYVQLDLDGGQVGDVSWLILGGYPNAGDFNIREAGVGDYLTIKKTTGNVGIGTGTPTTPDGTNADDPDIGLGLVVYGANPGISIIDSDGSSGHSSLIFGRAGVTTNQYRAAIKYDQAGDDLHFHVGGANLAAKMVILDTGFVGIGTASPGAKLEVNATAGASSYIRINAAANKQSALEFTKADSQEWIIYQDISSEDLKIYDVDGVGDMVTFQTGGNVGIGLSDPDTLLQVKGTLRLERSNSEEYVNMFTTGGFYFDNNNSWIFRDLIGTNKFIIHTNGDVGIGNIATPGAKLDVRGSAIFNEDSADVDFRIESDTNTHALFVQGSDGNVGIGDTTPDAKLDVAGDIQLDGLLKGTSYKKLVQPGVGTFNGVVTSGNYYTINRFEDGVVDIWKNFQVPVPTGATGLTSIKVYYVGAHTGNLYLKFASSRWSDTAGTAIQTDETDSWSLYAGQASGTGIETVPAGAYDGLTFDEGDMLGLYIEREASVPADTYTANWDVLWIEFIFS